MDEERGLQQAGLAISNRTPISTTMPLCDVWLILSALQMTVTHPNLHEPLKQAMERIGRDLEARIVEVLPDVAELAAAGWDRDQDYIDPEYEYDDDDYMDVDWEDPNDEDNSGDDDDDSDWPYGNPFDEPHGPQPLPAGVTVEEIRPGDPDYVDFQL